MRSIVVGAGVAAGHALGEPPQRLTLGAVAPHWIARRQTPQTGGPNQAVSASGSPASVPSPTHAT